MVGNVAAFCGSLLKLKGLLGSNGNFVFKNFKELGPRPLYPVKA